MALDVFIDFSVDGENVPCIGVNIQYGARMLPSAVVQIDPVRNSAVICNVESLKRKPAVVTVKTTRGCITFNGMLDGLATTQAVGSASVSLVVKSIFQPLFEMYPASPSIHPMGMNPYTVNPFLNKLGGVGRILDSIMGSEGGIATEGENVIDYYFKLLAETINQQRKGALTQIEKDSAYDSVIATILLSDPYQAKLEAAGELIQKIDTSATKGAIMMAQQQAVGVFAKEALLSGISRGNLWDSLVQGMSAMGCTFVVGKDKIFIVPENRFLLAEAPAVANIANASDYNMMSYSDNAVMDIGHYFLRYDPRTMNGGGDGEFPIAKGLGGFSEKKGSTGAVKIGEPTPFEVLGLQAPTVSAAAYRTATVDVRIGDSDVSSEDLVKSDAEINGETTDALNALIEDNFNKLAEMQFYRVKYANRTGSASLNFNPRWVPAATGRLHLQIPGLMFDFYVESVTHSFEKSPGNHGSARTSIGYSSGRVTGQSGRNAGVLTDPFYHFDSSKAGEFKQSFLDDVTTS